MRAVRAGVHPRPLRIRIRGFVQSVRPGTPVVSVRGMSFTLLRADEAQWRPAVATQALGADVAGPLGASTFAARLWRLEPGRFLARHRHDEEHELYLLLEGTGRIHVDGEDLTLTPLSAVLVEPATVRQLFNDTDADALWFVIGAPQDRWDLPAERIAARYPDGPQAPPPQLRG